MFKSHKSLRVCLLRGIRQQGELPLIAKEQKRSAAAAGGCVPGFALHSSYHCRFTQTSQQKQTSHDISCIFPQTNSPEALKASHVWPIKHTRARFCFFVHFLQRAAETRETTSPRKREDTCLHTATVFIQVHPRNDLAEL